MSVHTVVTPHRLSCAPSRAARELGLKRGEFDLAVHLGHIQTVPDEGVGGRRVPRSEIDRLCAHEGFPESLRARVKAVGTTAGAAVMEVPPGRFTRLARLGLVVPVTFYLNRYRAVVWQYLAEELRQFAADEKNTRLLKARMPEGLRDQLDAGLDLRARNWRGRHLGFLLRPAGDPWEQAGAVAAFLDPVQIAEIIPDPYERSHLNRFRPGPPAHGAPGSPAAHLAERIMTADDPDEIGWLRADLVRCLEEARQHRPAPRPATKPTPATTPAHRAAHHDSPVPEEPQPPRKLLGWLRRGAPRPARL
ncbi:DUF6397 family protein [Streptomyces sp. MMG1533]|uniref:DUF6397 family protein n=1 Tax=Streptomyces sp. MMG1533 TaxID=1415546 RepID=UPI0006AF7EC8|nr:DUF6397 family protein [Streptomyces sp. MMG1533]